VFGFLSAERRTRLRPYVSAGKLPGMKGKRWFVEGFFPKSVDHRMYVHEGTIRHVFRRFSVERGIKHRVVIGCPVVDPATGARTSVRTKKDRKTGERYPVCSVPPITMAMWHPDTKAERRKVRKIHVALGKGRSRKPSAITKAVQNRERNLKRIEQLMAKVRRTRKTRSVAGTSRSRQSGMPVGMTVSLIGIGALAVVGTVLSFAKKKSDEKGTSGLKDLPTHYPFYPRTMPSDCVPAKVHRDAQIIQHQEVNAAGKVILDEEIQPIEHVKYIPNFFTGHQPKLPSDPFEFSGIDGVGESPEEQFMGMDDVAAFGKWYKKNPQFFKGRGLKRGHHKGEAGGPPGLRSGEKAFMGTDMPTPVYSKYSDDLEAVNATYEKVSGLEIEGLDLGDEKAPATVEEMMKAGIMSSTLEDEKVSRKAKQDYDERLSEREGTADEVDDSGPDEAGGEAEEDGDDIDADVMEEGKAEEEKGGDSEGKADDDDFEEPDEEGEKDEKGEKEDDFEEIPEDDVEAALDKAEGGGAAPAPAPRPAPTPAQKAPVRKPVRGETLTPPPIPGRPPGGGLPGKASPSHWVRPKGAKGLPPPHAVAKGVRRKVTRISGIEVGKLGLLAEMGEYDKASPEAFEGLEEAIEGGLL